MTIVTAVDGEVIPSRAVEIADSLAMDFGESHVILHVMPENLFEGGEGPDGVGGSHMYPPSLMSEGARGEDGQVRRAEVDPAGVARRVVERTLEDQSNVEVEGRIGDIVDEIVEFATNREARYLVVGGRKRTPVGKAVMGSITQSVLLESDRPVMVIPQESERGTADGPVVAAIDRSERAPDIVTEAATLAERTGRELYVVHALTRQGFANLDHDSSEDPTANQLAAAGQSVASEVAEGITDEFTAVGLAGKPGKGLVEFAEEEEASYIVTGGRKRSAVGKVLFGSVTQSIILNANCPVLTRMGE